MENLDLYIESLIFASDKSISVSELKAALNTHFKKSKLKDAEIKSAIENIKEKYVSEDYSFEIICINEGYQFMTKGAYHGVIGQHLRLESKKKLSRAALETLAIISYKQPSTKSDIESIRGVNCDYSIQKLLEKELIEIKGRAEGPGRPLIYATTSKFMNHLGLESLSELPKLKEFETEEENTIGLSDEEANLGSTEEVTASIPVDVSEQEIFDIDIEQLQDSTVNDSEDKNTSEEE